MDPIHQHISDFEQKLTQKLVEQTTRYNILAGKLLSSQDINEYWRQHAPEYLADAVLQVRQYPLTSVAWAAYMGMGVAHEWDTNWERGSQLAYTHYYGDQGFDNMDDHVMANLLGVDIESVHATTLAVIVQNLARTTISTIQHQGVEPQTKMAYLLFATSCKAMFRLGAAIELFRLGYKWERLK